MKWTQSFLWSRILVSASFMAFAAPAIAQTELGGVVPVRQESKRKSLIEIEEEVIRLVEEGHVSEAQDLARRSAASGEQLVRLEGILSYATGQADAALVALGRASRVKPRDPLIAVLLAEVQCWKLQTAKAALLLETVSQAVVSASLRPWVLSFHQARVLGWLGRYEDAEGQYRTTYNFPGVPFRVRILSQVGLAEIAAWRKHYKDALRIVELALTDSPGNLEAVLMKGQILEWQGHYRDARLTYTRALQSSPGLTELNTRLENLSWVK